MKKYFFLFLICFNNISYSQSSFDISLEEKAKDYLNQKTVEFNQEYTSNRIQTELFNISIPFVRNFLHNISPTSSNLELSTTYLEDISIQGVPQSLCAITIKLNKKIINDYITLSHFSQEDTITYLIDHEFSHCITFHFKINLNEKDNENFADLFAIFNAELNNRSDLTAKIIYNNRKLPDSEVHKNPVLFEKFFEYIHSSFDLNNKFSIQQRIEIILNFLQKNSS